MNQSNLCELTCENLAAEVHHTPTPVLVYFWAQWCSSCKKLQPIWDELVDQYGGRLKFARVDIDGEPGLAAEYGIRATPTLVLVRQQQIIDRFVGVRSKRDLVESFERLVG